MKIFKSITIVLSICFLHLNATDLNYHYDNAGNRDGKRIIPFGKQAPEKEYKDEITGHDIRIYPNPTNGILSVKIGNIKNDEKTRIEIFSITGQLITLLENLKEITDIDLSEKTNGIYIMKIFVNNQRQVWKVIKED